jgi:hypothetical protein|tara:strand:+ start:2344 stop:2562 length:219 start_codon:yes stop_codon:yes gene_type:complete
MEIKKDDDTIEHLLDELPKLLVSHAYKKLKSGEDLTASEMKVCLDVCKAYSAEKLVEKPNNILETLPFDTDE